MIPEAYSAFTQSPVAQARLIKLDNAHQAAMEVFALASCLWPH